MLAFVLKCSRFARYSQANFTFVLVDLSCMRFLLSSCMLCFFCLHSVSAQLIQSQSILLQADKKITQYDHRVWTTQDGISSNSIEKMVYDANHYLWLGTFGGLVRFDGNSFKVYGSHNVPLMRNNAIMALAIDQQQRLWIGTQVGIILYKDGNFYKENLLSKIDSCFINNIFSDSKNNVWIGTPMGLWKFKENKLYNVSVFDEKSIRMIHEDQTGTLWVGTEQGELFKSTNYQDFSPILMPKGIGDIQCIFRDRKNQIWVGTYNGVIKIENSKAISYPALSKFDIYDIQEDKEGNLWFAGNALIRMSASGQIEVFPAIRHQINQMLPDPAGLVWLATENGGLHCLSDGLFRPYSTTEGMRANVARAICEVDQGGLWIGYEEGGIDELRNGHAAPVPGIPNNLRVKHLMRDRAGTVWISTYEGLFRKAGNGIARWTESTRQIPDNSIRLTYEDRAGNLWVGTRLSGLYCRTTTGQWLHYTEQENGLGSNFIVSLCEGANGDMLIGSKAGLDMLRQGKVMKHIGIAEGLPGNLVFSIRPDGGNGYWLALQGGLAHISPAGIRSYTQANGLSSNGCYDVLRSNGYLWVPTQIGVMRINEQKLLAFNQHANTKIDLTYYGKRDGMKDAECIGAAFSLKSSNQQLWFLTNGGVVTLDPNMAGGGRLPQGTYIEEVQYDTTTVLFQHQAVTIPANVSRFSVYFSSVDFLSLNKVQFRYKLLPFENEWVYLGTNRMVSFTNLSHGQYSFLVEASSDGQHWQPAVAALTLIQQQPLYKQRWIQLLAVFALLALAAGIYFMRVRAIEFSKQRLECEVEARTAELREKAEQIAHQNDELRSLSSEKNYMMSILAHDVRTPLNHIRGLVDVIFTDPSNLTEMQQKFLKQIGISAEKLGELTNQLLDFRSIEANSLSIELSEQDIVPIAMMAAESFRNEARRKNIEIVCEPHAQEALATCNRDYLKLILDNLVSNAIKFSPFDKKIKIYTFANEQVAGIAVADEGPGILPDDMPKLFGRFQRLSAQPTGGEKSVGLGLSIVKKYVETMHGSIRVESEPGKGATFVVEFPRT